MGLSWFSKVGRNAFGPSMAGLCVVFFALQVSTTQSGILDEVRKRLEWMAYDLRMELMLSEGGEPDPRVVIVDIDERSLQQEGHWPWPRQKIAQLTANLFDVGALVVGYDIVFPESAPNPAVRVLEALERRGEGEASVERVLVELSSAMDGDLHLVNSLEGMAVVLGFVFEYREGEPSGILPPFPIAMIDPELAQRVQIPKYPNYAGNIPAIQERLPFAGFFNTDPDSDGVVRRSPLVGIHGTGVYPSLALEMVNQYFGAPGVEFIFEEQGGEPVLEGITLPPELITIPTNSAGEVLIPFRGQERSYRYISATDVLAGRFPAEQVRDALILVGTSAAGLFDLRATPVDKVFPGVEVHANLISAMLDETFPIRTAWAEGVDLAILVVVGLLFALLFPHLRPIWLLGVWVSVTIAYVGVNFWLWKTHHLVTSLAIPLATLLTLTLLNMTWGYLRETRNRARLSNMFGQYVPAELVKEMNRNPGGHFGFEGESREMTVLFCDIRRFTTLSEALPANELKRMLNFFFTPMTKVIFENRGTVDKYVGDMIMAFWGAPLEDTAHRRHAITTALQMLQRLEEMEAEFRSQGWPVLQMGVGINSGMMNVGDMGSTYRRAYTVLGDAVNMGSRLEGLTKFYSVKLIVGEDARRGEEGHFLFRLLDRVRVKGRDRAVEIFEPICTAAEAGEGVAEAVARHQQGMEAYFACRWNEAEAAFSALCGQFENDDFYHLMQERIDVLRSSDHAEGWDGVYTHTSK